MVLGNCILTGKIDLNSVLRKRVLLYSGGAGSITSSISEYNYLATRATTTSTWDYINSIDTNMLKLSTRPVIVANNNNASFTLTYVSDTNITVGGLAYVSSIEIYGCI